MVWERSFPICYGPFDLRRKLSFTLVRSRTIQVRLSVSTSLVMESLTLGRERGPK
jgi:hypothetical protein